ncbi:DNA polymerase I [Candidatus Venteria ishoeyi]|uniref:DNA polymerase I n=1 Tax=Candidatus Venteria ishoeyi TaxID=1899563 RepID=A0A1H6F9I6_9GAMM|nr:DNA polymerase I [Candidatus Venteria ishoeyi]SEH06051.1 DNA polymerase I [Candidatus Venteria ishoeyi]
MNTETHAPTHSEPATLYLVDGSAYLYRAFYAMPSLSNTSGQPTGAIYGITNMLRRLLKEHHPQYIAVVFDAKGKTFRDDWYPEYKANRPPMPEELRAQIEPIHQIVKAMGLPLLMEPGVEADDVIGTLTRQAQALDMPVKIFTGDKDMAQLVNPQVCLIDTMQETVLDEAGVEDKFGILPAQIIDYLALVGDTSDNVPGVPKVGPKTAVKWLKQYGSLAAILEQAEQIKGKVGENLRNSLEQIPLSEKLVTIRCDLPLRETPLDLKRGETNIQQLSEYYRDLAFKSWLEELELGDHTVFTLVSEQNTTAPEPSHDYQTILSHEQWLIWKQKLEQAPYFAFDTETTALDYMEAHLVGVSFAVASGEAAYLPLAHDYLGVPQQLDRAQMLAELKPLLENSELKKIGQHIKYDAHILQHEGIMLRGIAYDTMLEAYALDSTGRRFDMDTLAFNYLGHQTIKFEDIAGKGKKQLTFNQIALEQAAPYAAEDADITLRLHENLWPQLQADKKLQGIFENYELPLLSVLQKIEHHGVLIDANALFQQSKQLAQRLQTLEQESYELAGEEFNLGSPKQLQVILFEKMGLPVLSKTPKGQPSTAESVLQELAQDYPLPHLIMEHRRLSKLKSTYTDKLPAQINPETGRVHTSYHQAVTVTGRLSSSNPNLQNIPIRTEEGRKIRQAFIPPQGKVLVAADYSQIELRIMAHLSGDAALLEAFANDLDVHSATAAEIFGVALAEVDKDQRRSAKAINFGLIYGMSAFGLAKQLNITRKVAQHYVDEYFERYPGVLNYMDETRQHALDLGYVETVFGRRLQITEINSRNVARRKAAERAAINAPMQGTAADIIKRAMIDVDAWISQSHPDVTMIMQVHDELVFELPAEHVTAYSKQICTIMEQAASLKVPLRVDAGYGKNWDEAH